MEEKEILIESEGLAEESAIETFGENMEASNKPNKPTEEEIAAAEKEFKDAIDAWNERTFQIGEATDAEKHTHYLKHFIANRGMWAKEQWMGVLKLNDVLDVAIASKVLKIEYAALEFAYFILMNPAGIGLYSAKNFEAEQEDYSFTLAAISEQLQKARQTMEDIKFLQDKWSSMVQGFYYEKDGVRPDENDKIPEGAYWDNELQRYIKPGDPDYSVDIYNELVAKKLEAESK